MAGAAGIAALAGGEPDCCWSGYACRESDGSDDPSIGGGRGDGADGQQRRYAA